VSVLSIRVGQRVLEIFEGKTTCCPHRQSPKKSNSSSVSQWRLQKVDKRMVLEYTHGLFIT
jgi:hypothetical protein